LRNDFSRAIEVYCEGEREVRGELTVSELAVLLGVTDTTVLRLIRQKRLPATQVCAHSPWVPLKDDVAKFQKLRERAIRID
jgi:excisionase family DNA binding protein